MKTTNTTKNSEKNTVYLVIGSWNYEGSQVLKAFSNRIKAEQEVKELSKKNDAGWDYIGITEMEIEE
jgi:hypothetical protein